LLCLQICYDGDIPDFKKLTKARQVCPCSLQKGVNDIDDKKLLKELNKILTLEHGHLGMYKNYQDYQDKEIRRAFRRFMEIEIEHINKIKNIFRNLGGIYSPLIESGDIIGNLLGITVNFINDQEVLKTYSFIENKAHEGYMNFVAKLEKDNEPRNNFIAEMVAANMFEAKLMHLWLEDKLRNG